MSLIQICKIEFLKVKRARIFPLLFVAPVLVVISGVGSLSRYFTPDYTNPWQAMFIQSALVFAYYLLPFTMTVVCVMLTGREKQNNGLQRMLTLPISRYQLAFGKYLVLLCFFVCELAVFFLFFIAAGFAAVWLGNLTQAVPFGYLLHWGIGLFLTFLPCLSVIWTFTVLFDKPLFSIGMNLLLTIPAILVAATPARFLYPYCYSGYLVSCALHSAEAGGFQLAFPLLAFLPWAIIIGSGSLSLSLIHYGK